MSHINYSRSRALVHSVLSHAVVGLLLLGSSGCGIISVEEKVDVETIAKDWPPYRAPQYFVDSPHAGFQGAAMEPSQTQTTETFQPRENRNSGNSSSSQNWAFPPIRARETWDFETTAVDALGRIGSGAVPKLSRELDSPDPQRRLRAAKILARIGPDAKSSVAKLSELLNDDVEEIKKAAARALGQIGPAAENAVEPLIEAMNAQ